MISQVLEPLVALQQQNRLGHAYILEGVQITQDDSYLVAEGLGVSLQDIANIMPDDKVSISVDQVRALHDRLSRKPISGMHLVLICPADRMNQAASNALLKLLEEPPGNSCFLLFTLNQRKLMQTIRSRAQSIYCQSNALDEWKSHPRYHEIHTIYAHSPVLLNKEEDIPLAIRLYDEVVLSDNPIQAIHGLDVEADQVLKASIVLLSAYIRQSQDQSFWSIYDDLCRLSQISQKSHNLNEKGIFDQVGMALDQLNGCRLN